LSVITHRLWMPCAGVPGECAAGKREHGLDALVVMQLDVRQPRMVVDDRVGALLADALLLLGVRTGAIPGDRVAWACEARVA
jgi:hypothetical protein